MIMKAVLPLLAVALASCASKQQPPQPIAAVAQQRLCPPYPLPPKALLTPPAKIDFLMATD